MKKLFIILAAGMLIVNVWAGVTLRQNANGVMINNSQAEAEVRPMNFVESKNFKTTHNEIFVGLCKDSKTNNYRFWVDCKTVRLFNSETMNGYITEYNTNNYKIEDTFGYKVQSFNFDNIYVIDANRKYQSGPLANEDVCKYVYELMSKYTTDIDPKYHLYKMKMVTDGNIEYKLEQNKNDAHNIYQVAKNNPMNFGKEMRAWDIETSQGKVRVKIYNADKNDSDFEVISIEHLKRQNPEIQVKEIVAANSHIYNKADALVFLERYQINAYHDKAGDIVLENKELWEFIYQLLSTKQCNHAAGAKETNFYHSFIKQYGIIEPGEDEQKLLRK